MTNEFETPRSLQVFERLHNYLQNYGEVLTADAQTEDDDCRWHLVCMHANRNGLDYFLRVLVDEERILVAEAWTSIENAGFGEPAEEEVHEFGDEDGFIIW